MLHKVLNDHRGTWKSHQTRWEMVLQTLLTSSAIDPQMALALGASHFCLQYLAWPYMHFLHFHPRFQSSPLPLLKELVWLGGAPHSWQDPMRLGGTPHSQQDPI